MRPFFAAIIFEDSEYSETISAELSLRRPDWTFLCGSFYAEKAEIFLSDDEDLCKRWPEKAIPVFQMLSAEDLLSLAEEKRQELGLEPALHPLMQEKDRCRFTLVTAAAGGRGLSTSAALLAQYYACFQEEKVLYLSLDAFVSGLPLREAETEVPVLADPQTGEIKGKGGIPPVLERLACRAAGELDPVEELRFYELLRAGLRKDGQGLFYLPQPPGPGPLAGLSKEPLFRFLSMAACSGFFDRIVLDVPCSFRHLVSLAGVCEEIILLKRSEKTPYSEAYLEELLRKEAAAPLEVLTVSEDESAAGLDLYGQLGWEVMDFAKNR